MIKLTCTINNERCEKELKEGNYIVGRSKSCDIVLRDPSISGQHVRIDVSAAGEVVFRDLLSRNGTVLNGAKVTQGKLKSGDTLRLGHIDVLIGGGGVVFDNPSELDLAPAPEPAGDDYALAPIASASAAVEVFQLPSTMGTDHSAPVAGPADASRKRIPVLLALLALAAVFVGGMVFLDKYKASLKGNAPQENAEEHYWKTLNNGVSDFRLGNYSEAAKIWLDAEERYEKSTGNRKMIGKNFAFAAQPFADSQSGNLAGLSGVDWNGLRRKMLDMVNGNQLVPELRDFAIEMEGRCRSEIESQEILKSADELKANGKWDEAAAKFNDIPSSSLYYAQLKKLQEELQQARRDGLMRDARAAAEARNYQQAIKLADEFISRGGDDKGFARELASWRNLLVVSQDLAHIKKLARDAVSAKEIDSARQIAKNLQQRFPDDSRVITEIPGILKDLTERLFIVILEQLYNAGNSAEIEKHLATGTAYRDNAQAKDIVRRWRTVSAAKTKADTFEEQGNLEAAITQWRTMIMTETNPNNRYNSYAKGKLKLYPPEKIGQMMLEGATKALNLHKYAQARELIASAKKYQVEGKEQFESLQRTGKVLFNQGVQSFHSKEFSQAFEQLNNALECFSPEDEYYNTITNWMQKNEIAFRKKE